MPLSTLRTLSVAAASIVVAVSVVSLTSPAGAPQAPGTGRGGAPAVGAVSAPAVGSPELLVTPELAGTSAAAGARYASAPAARATAAEGGYTLHVAKTVGITPKGLRYYVDKGAKHDKSLVKHTKAAVSILRNQGVNASYGGYGTPAAAEGRVRVSEGKAGCKDGHAGRTWPRVMELPSGEKYVWDARVVLCPGLWKYDAWQVSALIRHEIGHSAGLGHFDKQFDGSTQVLRSVNANRVASYKSGDINGLQFLARHNTYVKKAIPPIGRFEGGKYVDGNVKLSGWSLLQHYKGEKVIIQVRDNGDLHRTVKTTVYRKAINDKYDKGSRRTHGWTVSFPWPGGTHNYCVTAVSPVKKSTKVSLGCSKWE